MGRKKAIILDTTGNPKLTAADIALRFSIMEGLQEQILQPEAEY